jgi:beta-glucosidase
MGEDSDALFYTLRVPQLANAMPMLDFVGISIYGRSPTSWPPTSFPAGARFLAKGHAKMCSSWRLGAEVRAVAMEKENFITENGCASTNVDVLAEDGDIYDADRIMFLRSYLIELIPNYRELSKR